MWWGCLGKPKMSGDTLSAIRDRIETLATEGGEYFVVCGRTGERPVPVENKRFPDRETAVTAAQTATAYRAVLREYDPRTPVYDLVVCQASEGVSVRTELPAESRTGLSEGTEGTV